MKVAGYAIRLTPGAVALLCLGLALAMPAGAQDAKLTKAVQQASGQYGPASDKMNAGLTALVTAYEAQRKIDPSLPPFQDAVKEAASGRGADVEAMAQHMVNDPGFQAEMSQIRASQAAMAAAGTPGNLTDQQQEAMVSGAAATALAFSRTVNSIVGGTLPIYADIYLAVANRLPENDERARIKGMIDGAAHNANYQQTQVNSDINRAQERVDQNLPQLTQKVKDAGAFTGQPVPIFQTYSSDKYYDPKANGSSVRTVDKPGDSGLILYSDGSVQMTHCCDSDGDATTHYLKGKGGTSGGFTADTQAAVDAFAKAYFPNDIDSIHKQMSTYNDANDFKGLVDGDMPVMTDTLSVLKSELPSLQLPDPGNIGPQVATDAQAIDFVQSVSESLWTELGFDSIYADFNLNAGTKINATTPDLLTPTPTKVITTPTTQVPVATTQIQTPTKVMTTPTTQVQTPTKVMTLPSTQIAMPSNVMTTPSTQIDMPSNVMTVPSTQIAGASSILNQSGVMNNDEPSLALCGR